MIGISTITSNENGSLIIAENPIDSEIKRLEARVSRTATLDGGCVITHGGVTDVDRTLRIVARIDETTESIINTIFRGETLIYVSTDDGFYSGAISRFNCDNGEMDMQILIKEKLSE